MRRYDTTKEGGKAFYELSDNYVEWNKGADISTTKTLPQWYKRGEMWDALNKRGMNEFIFRLQGQGFMTEKQVARVFKQLEDHGYYVVARRGEGFYYVSRKYYTHLTLDFKTEKVYKRGVKD